MKIKSIEAAGAFWRPGDIFPDDLPQVAFAGRSNVGKSSLINRLLGRRRLAATSATPGKTRKIHFFKINGFFYLVDLPGYGYTKLPVEVRERWRHTVERFLTGSRALAGVICLVDIRRGLAEADRQLLFFLADKNIPLLIALTKADKLKFQQRKKTVESLLMELGGAILPEQVIPTSAQSGEGCAELLAAVEALISGPAKAEGS
ncbi:MAG: hypothetical protein A2Z86_00475 [Candidatus Glassbacteria bacterium GWA2_58_10]|uniref:Probable GTP-binding protein EngB n=1 Tax=Candidatus Glassbacteria bacterium GWA2_58_10 TaxID=1817865 RepID=A0A1F5YCE9_9BACT|nr:MAG: hypothetical protein A2Z86_00475 [Candidatus Glassbacteria bacterium GWA2_58_10]